MRRTGSLRAFPLAKLCLLLSSAYAFADIGFLQKVEPSEVGLEDTFRLLVVASDAPDFAQIDFPSGPDFEVLSKSQSTELSYQFGSGGSGIRRTQKYVLVLRPNRVGTLTIAPSVMTVRGKTYRTEPLRVTVKQGRLADPRAQRGNPPDPFRRSPFPRFPALEDEDEDASPLLDVPRSDADLFLRSSLDRDEVFAGEQVTFSIYIFSRVDLTSVDAVTLPKLDGFWSEDLESPTQLSGEQKTLNGVPYRAYLLRRRALFPMKPGNLQIGNAEADVTTGFLFAGRRVHRTANELLLKVKPLPSGAPAGFSTPNVGVWKLSAEAPQAQIQLGQPLAVRVALEGRGNVVLPSVTGPSSVHIYDPTTTDKVSVSKGKIGGRRIQEYLVMARQTGVVTFPALGFTFFNPETGRYETSRTDPIVLTAVPASESASLVASPSAAPQSAAKNVLSAGGLRPLRHQAHFSQPARALWRRGVFISALLAPLGAWFALALIGWVRARTREDESGIRRKRTRAARRRLAGAEKLKLEGKSAEFYAEVEKALLQFLQAKLGVPVAGLTREALAQQLQSAGVSAECQERVFRVLDACDLARFSPSGAQPEHERALDDAAAAMEGWDSK
jgi:hypothetical protein